MNQKALRDWLLSGEAFGTSLLALLVDRSGTEAVSWHPEALREFLRAEVGAEPPQAELDKLLAACAVLLSDEYRALEDRFTAVAHALAGNGLQYEVYEPASVAELAWAVAETCLLDPPDGPPAEAFSPGVRALISETLREEGFLSAPAVLKGLAEPPSPSLDFTDDPELYSAVYQTQRDRAAEVESVVRHNLRELSRQLSALPLREADRAGWAGHAANLAGA